MKQYRLTSAALKELRQAILYYEQRERHAALTLLFNLLRCLF